MCAQAKEPPKAAEKQIKRVIENQEEMKMCKYSEIKNFEVADEWEKKEKEKKWIVLNWEDPSLPEQKAGIYRVQLVQKIETKTIPIHPVGQQKIIADLTEGTYLSVGKSSNLHQRLLFQHFSKNHCGNRLGRHLANLFLEYKYINPEYINKDSKVTPYIDKDGIRSLIAKKIICIDFFYEAEWWKRDLYETYGKVHHKCLFDLGIEH
ncbi:MAG: hypothetical protein IJS14_02280 [Lentisphaeria bacterium]|nr:hypothetical protein [Lentisphaeria bacterium]